MQDVQGLSLSYALKIAGPKNFFIVLVRPKVELNRDSCIFLGGILPLEVLATKSPYFAMLFYLVNY